MRVVFLEDVEGVARGGDVREVKNGFARNYLIPKNLAEPATHNALQRVGRLKVQADEFRLKTLSDMKALAEDLDGSKGSCGDEGWRGGQTVRLCDHCNDCRSSLRVHRPGDRPQDGDSRGADSRARPL